MYTYTFTCIIIYVYIYNIHILSNVNCLHFSICACRPCAGAMLIFSVPFQV